MEQLAHESIKIIDNIGVLESWTKVRSHLEVSATFFIYCDINMSLRPLVIGVAEAQDSFGKTIPVVSTTELSK